MQGGTRKLSHPSGAREEPSMCIHWLLQPMQLWWGEMGTSLLTNEIRQESHCSWLLWLIASS